MADKSFQKYYEKVRKIFRKEDYTEYTFRTSFENFIESLNEKFDLFQEPKRKCELGAPDFRAFRNGAKIGYIETKNLGKNLDEELESDQLEKYTNSIDNIILSNYYRFILIRNGDKVFDFNLFNLSDLKDSSFSVSKDKAEKFLKMLESFYGYEIETIESPQELAKELSKRARLLKDLSQEQLEADLGEDENEEKSPVYDFYLGMKEMKDLDAEDCAEAYAQTIAYGLFLAKMNSDGKKIVRRTASAHVPKHIGIIKKIFRNISGDALPSNIGWIVEEIIDILNASSIEEIESKINSRKQKDKDPYIYFYEDFLTRFDPKKKKHLGVFYTPRPVVNFIVNSIHEILKNDFDKHKGLADSDVKALDPAIGTGTFFWIAFLVVLNELKDSGMSGMIDDKIKNHILENFYGLEILITPYIISHLKLMGLLNSWHYDFDEDDGLEIYLTNTLEPVETHGLMPFMRELTEESKAANRIITEEPILAIMGNPPYSVSSENKSDWIEEKMEDYKKNLDEKNIQPLSDDYIKFIRFAQWKIEENGEGVIGFITNNSYLDGIIHRRMREELLDTFDRIYILNLHGSSRVKEELPDDVSKDENVFDIQQGVAISLFVKNDNLEDTKVYYSDLFGNRNEKYKKLDKKVVNNVQWDEIETTEPYYFFVPKDFSKKKYGKFWKVTDIFENHSSGIKTHRDDFVVGFDKKEIKNRMNVFTGQDSDEEVKEKLNLRETKAWKIKEARDKVSKTELEKDIHPYSYRPLDSRYICYNENIIDRERWPFMKSLLKNSLSLVTTRILSNPPFKHVFVSNSLSDICLLSTKTKETSYFFPLYTFEDGKGGNFTEEFKEFISEKYQNNNPNPEQILGYIYGVLHSETYRDEFNEFLKIDFPRVPFVDNFEKFKKISKLGKKLIDIHLMNKKFESQVKFDIKGSNKVEKYEHEENKVYINEDQYFKGIDEEAWNFEIGSYQVLRKWLKYRKGRELDSEEIEHFIQMVEVIKKTRDIMEEINEIQIF